MNRKLIILILSASFLTSLSQNINQTKSNFSKFGLRTSDIFELLKGTKCHAIVIGDMVTIYENYKSVLDTTFYRKLYGEFQIFKHDSINANDSLLIIPYEIIEYYVLSKNNTEKVTEISRMKTNDKISISYYSITKIKHNRKTYKLCKTKKKEKVWCNGNLIKCPDS